MKILMASHYFASHKGGIEIVADELYRGLTAKGQEVVWIAGDTTPAPDATGSSRPVPLPIFNFVERSIGLPLPIPKLRALQQISRELRNTDIIILHDCLYLSNILTFVLAYFRDVPTVIIQHVGVVPYSSLLLNAAMRISNALVTQPMLSRATQVIFISETTRSFFSQVRFKTPPEIIFNGVDINLYRSLREDETKSGLRRDHDLPETGRVILFVGRFVEKKGLRIMQRMAMSRPDWTWAFAGWGPLDPSNWNATNVKVFSNLHGPSMAALYRACDLLVLPSTGEGFPLVVQEALASGLPVVCSAETLGADPAMTEFVRGVPVYTGDDERTGREFISAIDESLSSDRAGIGDSTLQAERRRAFAESRYSWRHAAERYLQIIEPLVPESAYHSAAAKADTSEVPR